MTASLSFADREAQVRAATADVIAWQDRGDHAARARAIQSVRVMVWHHAHRTHRRVGRFGVALEDLVSAGLEGATRATDKFDRTRGPDYVAAAEPIIRWGVSHYARHAAGVVSIPRSRVAYALEIAVNRAAASAETAGMSSDAAMSHAAAGAGVSTRDAAAVARRLYPVSFDPEVHGGVDENDGVLARINGEQVAGILDDCLAELRPTHSAVIRAHDIEGRPINEIAARDGVTPRAIRTRRILALAELGRVMRERGLRLEDLI